VAAIFLVRDVLHSILPYISFTLTDRLIYLSYFSSHNTQMDGSGVCYKELLV